MGKHSAARLPYHLPLAMQPNERIGAGKDNRVYTLDTKYSRPDIRPEVAARAGDLVVKAGNAVRKGELWTAESAHNNNRYKQEKYNLLHHFLGDRIPRSSFFVGSQ